MSIHKKTVFLPCPGEVCFDTLLTDLGNGEGRRGAARRGQMQARSRAVNPLVRHNSRNGPPDIRRVRPENQKDRMQSLRGSGRKAGSAPLCRRDGRGRLFRRGLHFMQIIREGNDGEENRKKTSQCDNALNTTRTARMSRRTNRKTAKEKSVTRGGDDGPREIECEFHQLQLNLPE